MSAPLDAAVAKAVGWLHDDALQASYRHDPVGWARDVLRVHLWSKQQEVAESVRDHKRTVAASCHGSGKSHSAGVLSSWWIAVHPPGEAIVITTAPTGPQVSAILWEEIRAQHARAKANGHPLPGYVTMGNEWKLETGRLVGMGRKPADGDQHAFQGIHRPYVLVIVDEAAGVPEELWTGVEAITTTANSRILAIGNPDDRDTTFGEVFCADRYARLWNRIRIPASSTPNFTGEEVPHPLNDLLIQRSWAEERRTAWGEEDPRYGSKVNAEFPDNTTMGLFGARVLAQGFDSADVQAQGRLILGVDCARFGDDRTAVVARRGRLAWVEESWSGMDTQESARRVMGIADRLRHRDEDGVPLDTDVEIRVDVIGLGAGVVDRLAEESLKPANAWFTVREINGAAAPPQEQGGSVQGYGNARAYFYDQCKQQMAAGPLKVVEHAVLRDELAGVRIKYSASRMYIESKEDMRKRGVKSPDFADALVYAAAPILDTPETGDVFGASAEEVSETEKFIEEMMERLEMQISPL